MIRSRLLFIYTVIIILSSLPINSAAAPSAEAILSGLVVGRNHIESLKAEFFLKGETSPGASDNNVRQTLFFRNPDRIRLNISWPDREEVFLAAGRRSLVMVGDQAADAPWPQPFIFYRLLCDPNPVELKSLLEDYDVDLERVSTGRYKGQIVFIIGAYAGDAAPSQLWFEKRTNRLVRFILAESGLNPRYDIALSAYREYESGLQWPGTMEVFIGDSLTSMLTLNRLKINPSIDHEALDVDEMSRTVAPALDPDLAVSDNPELKKIRKQMEWFRKKLE